MNVKRELQSNFSFGMDRLTEALSKIKDDPMSYPKEEFCFSSNVVVENYKCKHKKGRKNKHGGKRK